MSDVWRIFVIDGEEALNLSLVNSLRKDGYIVQGVLNGVDAVRILWSEEFDVVICDLKTPAVNGFELLQWLRAYRPNTGMIMVGDAGSAPLRLQALESGAVSYLERPLDFRLLKDELRRLLQQTGFSASLDSFDLLDVIQIITLSRKSIALLINIGLEERGILRFQNGELAWAEYGILRGEEAFFALAAHKNGTVNQQVWDEQGASNVTQPLSRLIFQALQYRTKYADRLQYSGEMDMVARPPVLANDELNDNPFVTSQEAPSFSPFNPAQPQQDNSLRPAASISAEGIETDLSKEWWERTGQITSVRNSSAINEMTSAPSFMQNERTAPPDTNISQPMQIPTPQAPLPSWLTDQPTAADLPLIRPSSLSHSGQMPAARLASSPEWQTPLSAIKMPEQLSPKQPTSLPFPDMQEAEPLQSGTIERTTNDLLGPTRPTQDILSFSPTGSISGPLSLADIQDSNPMLSSATLNAQKAARRNYTALVSALQTLGYSITGFVAAAVVSIEGQPIAQVAIDDLDVSKLCKPFSNIQKSIMQALDQGNLGEYEDTIITSRERHIMMRVVGTEKRAFQVLITTRETNPAESLEVMANVEGAISAALR